ncbi:MAG: hypothetical protein M0R74_15435, partial [Dehalococcoidia bacterium]|nr:hypothetical protein [Dehalococcoidia bacterium]
MAEAKEFAFDFSGLPDKPEGVEGKAFEFDFSALPDKPEDPNAPKIQQGKEEPWTKLFSGGYLVGPGNKITGGAPGQDMALVMGLSEQFDVTPSFAADHKAELSQLAIRREQPRATDVAMQSAVALGLITHPHATLLGVGAYMLVDLMEGLIGGAVRSKLTGGEFRAFNLSQLKPGDAPEWQKNTLEAIDFAHKAALAGGITKGAGPLWERFTKKTFESYGLPREVYISADKIKDIFQTGEKISGEEMDLVKGLGLTGEQYREAIRNGIDISIPTEKIVRVADKPWYAKLKQAIKITPYEEVLSSTPAGKPKARTHTERLGAPETAEKAAPELRGASKDSDGTIKQPVGYVLPKGRTIAEEARLVTAAMGQVESGNRAVVPGQVFPGGWIQGRFQYEPETWKQYSAEYNQALYQKAEPLPNTDTNQQLVTEWKVAQWLEQGYSPKQIAATWNSGS